MKKIAYVVPTFPNEIDKKKNELVDNICNAAFDMDVITTCAVQENEFVNVCIPGVYEEEKYRVIRFLIEDVGEKQERERLLEELPTEEWYRVLRSLGGYSPELYNYIHRTWKSYDAVIFFGMDYWPTIIGMHAIQNAIIIPCISSKNIRYACTKNYRNAFNQVDYAICFEEREYSLLSSLDMRKVCLIKSQDISSSLEQITDKMSFDKQGKLETIDIEKEILYSAKLKPAYVNNNVPIILASDNNYVHLLCVALQSIIDSSDINNNYDFIILSDKISFKSRRNVYNICIKYSNMNLRFVEVSELLENNEFSFRCQQLSRAAFARLLLPELLVDYEKIVYLDCDILARKDIADLFNTDIKSAFVAAIEDPFIAVLRENRDNERKHVSLHVGKKADEKYFNSGVLVMNLDMFRKHYTSEKMFAVATQRTWMWEDQDVLNKLCMNQVVWLQINWNYLWGREEIVRDLMKLKPDYFDGYYNPYIIHYAGGCTPLRAINDEYDVEFWNVARRTPYYETLLADMMKNRCKIQNWMQEFVGGTSVPIFSGNLSSRDNEQTKLLIQAELPYNEPVVKNGLRGMIKEIIYKASRCLFVPFVVTQTNHNKKIGDVLVETSRVGVKQQDKIDDCRQALLELSKVLNATNEG